MMYTLDVIMNATKCSLEDAKKVHVLLVEDASLSLANACATVGLLTRCKPGYKEKYIPPPKKSL